MKRGITISVLIIILLAAGGAGAHLLLPKRYTVGERVTQTTVFWNDQEAFLFLNVMTLGKAQNTLQDRLAASRYGYLTMLGGYNGFHEQQLIAYHLLPSGKLDRLPVPANTAVLGSWALVDEKLQLRSFANGYKDLKGFAWDGTEFVAVPPEKRPAAPPSARNEDLSPDDVTAEDDDSDPGYLDKSQRKAFKDAGWHYKFLSGYEGGKTEATLPVALHDSKFNLVVRSSAWQSRPNAVYDFLAIGTRELELSGAALTPPTVVWTNKGWQEIPKSEYLRRAQLAGDRTQLPVATWTWLIIMAVALLWRFAGWGHLLFTFATVKGRVVENMPTSYSFPPALPAQFPSLDVAALERYTRDFESMGFSRLLDFSLVSDRPNAAPSFVRLLVHSGHHCFAEVGQLFPRGKSPMALKCSIQSYLQDGWTVAFSDRKPIAASSLMRRKKALGVCMPEASPAELLQSLIKLRQQVCLDLGLSPLTHDTMETYIARTQLSVSEMREAVKQKSFVTGLPQLYYRKLALLKTRPEYVWLGDYPKLAEQRKRGYGLATAT